MPDRASTALWPKSEVSCSRITDYLWSAPPFMVGPSIEEATTLAIVFERAARLQLLARSIGALYRTRPRSIKSGVRRSALLYKEAYLIDAFSITTRVEFSHRRSCTRDSRLLLLLALA